MNTKNMTFPSGPTERRKRQEAEKGLVSFQSRVQIKEPLVKALRDHKIKYTWRTELCWGGYGPEMRYYEATIPGVKVIKIQREKDIDAVDLIIRKIQFGA